MSKTHLTDVTFASLGLPAPLLHALHDMNFTQCTPIQAKTLPLLLQGKNVAGQAQTGTGKTIAFLLGTMTDLLRLPETEHRRQSDPRAVILAPTRELAIQIYDDAVKLGKHTELKISVVYGGSGYEQQRTELEQGVDILIGTPGRLIDYFKQKVFSFYAVDVMVLDEADRMFDLGFIADIRFLFRRMPPATDRLNMLFSATLSHKVNELAYEHMNAPEHVQVEPEQVTAGRIKETLFYPSNDEKFALLVGLMQQHQPEKAIVFTNTKRAAEQVWGVLAGNDFKAGLLTGDVPQKKRIRLLDELKDGTLQVLVATDVAARGLHIDDVSHVYNFQLPDDPEDYVHRIGRTARAGATGDAISFACEDSAMNLPGIEDYISHVIPTKDIDPALLVELKPSEPVPHNRRSSGSGGGRPKRRSPHGRGRNPRSQSSDR